MWWMGQGNRDGSKGDGGNDNTSLNADRPLADFPILIRIVGGKKDGDTTLYAWQEVYHPNDQTASERPREPTVTLHRGPKTSGGPDNELDYSAIEASGSDAVPVDGSVVVLAWISPAQDRYIFTYVPRLLGKITDKIAGASYIWEEVQPSSPAGGVMGFETKSPPVGIAGTAQYNPAYEVMGRDDVPLDGSVIIEILRYPTRVHGDNPTDYFIDRPQAEVTTTTHGNGTSIHEVHSVAWTPSGEVYGLFTITVMIAGVPLTTATIATGATDNQIRDAIQDLAGIASVAVTGTRPNFAVEFLDDFDSHSPIWIDDRGVYSAIPYYFWYWGVPREGGSGSGGDSPEDPITTFFDESSGCLYRAGDYLCQDMIRKVYRNGILVSTEDIERCCVYAPICCDQENPGSGSSENNCVEGITGDVPWLMKREMEMGFYDGGDLIEVRTVVYRGGGSWFVDMAGFQPCPEVDPDLIINSFEAVITPDGSAIQLRVSASNIGPEGEDFTFIVYIPMPAYGAGFDEANGVFNLPLVAGPDLYLFCGVDLAGESAFFIRLAAEECQPQVDDCLLTLFVEGHRGGVDFGPFEMTKQLDGTFLWEGPDEPCEGAAAFNSFLYDPNEVTIVWDVTYDDEVQELLSWDTFNGGAILDPEEVDVTFEPILVPGEHPLCGDTEEDWLIHVFGECDDPNDPPTDCTIPEEWTGTTDNLCGTLIIDSNEYEEDYEFGVGGGLTPLTFSDDPVISWGNSSYSLSGIGLGVGIECVDGVFKAKVSWKGGVFMMPPTPVNIGDIMAPSGSITYHAALIDFGGGDVLTNVTVTLTWETCP